MSHAERQVVPMYLIQTRENLCPGVVRMDIEAPLIAKKAQPGQFIILRTNADSERIPLTVADCDLRRGAVSIIFQTVGAGTMELAAQRAGDSICDFVGPLGRPTELEGLKSAAVIGGGVGCAIAYPIAKALHQRGVKVHSILGFRDRSLMILKDEFEAVSDSIDIVTDDGSYGEKGLVTDALRRLIESGEQYDEVITIGPLPMMKFVCKLTKEYGVKTIASMNPIMIDGTGMCGGCRLTVGGQTRFACVDGPEFDGHEIDFDEAIARSATYRTFERHAHEAACNLFREVRTDG